MKETKMDEPKQFRELNRRFPWGDREAAGDVPQRGLHDANCVSGHEMPDGILSMTPINADPHGAGPHKEFQITPSARRPVGEPVSITPPHSKGPHDHLHPAPHHLAKAR
jgi:hypothetical protein